MTERTLRDVLDRATDEIGSPDLVATALLDARRRRIRQRGAVAALGSGLAVVSVIAVLAVVDRDADQEPAPGGPTPTTTHAPAEPRLAPEIDPDTMQPVWDPDQIQTMPWDESLGLPQDLTPVRSSTLAPSSVVAAADHAGLFCLLLPTGEWVNAGGYPEPGLRYVDRALALSDDGSRIALTGRSGLWWRDLPDGDWQQVDYPGDLQLPTDTSLRLEFGDEETVVLDHFDRFWTVDLIAGTSERLPFDVLDDVTALPDGDLVASRFADSRPVERSVVRLHRGEVVLATDPTALQSIQRAVASDTSLVVTRAYGGGPVPPPETALDGLLALELDGLTTRAFLPVEDESTWYSDGGALTAIGWLDDDTVLAQVQPRADADTVWLVTWDVESGELRRVGSYPRDVTMAFATEAM